MSTSPNQPMTLAPDGNPFTSKKLANEYIKKEELDPEFFRAYEQQGGWCIFNLSVLPNGMKDMLKKAAETKKTKSKVPEDHESTKFYVVIFQAKTSPNDEDDVPLGLNGTTILSKRDQEVILPGSYLEVADHTVKNQYEQKPGHDRKIVGKVRKFMYQRIREVTREKFEEFKKTGNAIRDQEIDAREHANS